MLWCTHLFLSLPLKTNSFWLPSLLYSCSPFCLLLSSCPHLEIFCFYCCIQNSPTLSIHSFSCLSDKIAGKQLSTGRNLHPKTCMLDCLWFLDFWFLHHCTVGGDSVVGWQAALILEDQENKYFLFSVIFWRMDSRRQSCSTHFMWRWKIWAHLLYGNSRSRFSGVPVP